MKGAGRSIGTCGLLLALLMPACAHASSFLSPAGPVAAQDRTLFWVVIGLLLVVVLPVFAGLPWVLWRYRRGNVSSHYRPDWDFSLPLELAAWGMPVVIVAVLSVFVWDATHRLDPYRTLPGAQPLEVQAIALDWKWLFIYPGENLATLNRLVVPAGRPVHVDLTSGTVMQAMLIPRLAGQVYAMAGMRTQLNFRADRAGVYRGANTQYNGAGFDRQSFTVDALAPADYSQWLAAAHAVKTPLDAARYAALARRSPAPPPQAFAPVAPHLFEDVIASFDDGQAMPQPDQARAGS